MDFPVEVRPIDRDLVLGLHAVDVNEHGIFVTTTEPLALHTAVQVRVPVAEHEALSFRGRVVRILWPDRVDPGEPPGFGIQFDALVAADAERWSAFCRDRAQRRAQSPERRAFLRVPTRCELHIRATSEASLRAFVTQNLSAGGAGFLTNAEMPLGLRLSLALHHPTTDEVFRLGGEVVRCEPVDLPGVDGTTETGEHPALGTATEPTEPGARSFRIGVRFDAPHVEVFRRLTSALPG